MIEQGFVARVQAGLGSPPTVNAAGGFAEILPKDLISDAAPMAWTYQTVHRGHSYNLGQQSSWTEWYVQIDCHGLKKTHALALKLAIEKTLRGGFSGTLTDPDATHVFGIFQQDDPPSGFSDANRTYVESLEYLVQYSQV